MHFDRNEIVDVTGMIPDNYVSVASDPDPRYNDGRLLCAIADGRFRPEAIHAELGEVVSGARPGRRDGAQITLFKSVGNAAQDVAVARRVLDVALARDLGATVEL